VSGKGYDVTGHAPPSLFEHHQGMKHALSILSKREISEDPLDPLFAEENQANMRLVWEELATLAGESGEGFKQVCLNYYDDCKKSLWLYGKTETERRAELEEIASLAEKLARKVAESELAWTSVLYYVRESLEGASLPEGAAIPRIEGLLVDLTEEARAAASRPHKHQSNLRLSKRENGEIPKSTFHRAFVRNLAKRMVCRYGAPFDNLVATTATVIFGMDTDTSYVKTNRHRNR